MTNEELDRQEEAEQARPNGGSESEEASDDLESLFADSEEDSQEDDPYKRLEKKYESLEKGIRKYISKQSEKKVETKPTETQEAKETGTSSVIKNLYFKANPEAQEVWDMVEEDAKALGKDPFELYETRQGYKLEAKARAEAKNEEEKNKARIARPSTQTGSSQIDISKTKPEEVDKLTPAQKNEWVKAQAKKEREQID